MREFISMYGPLLIMVVQLGLVWILWSLSRKFCTVEKCEQHRVSISEERDKTKEKITHELEGMKGRIGKLPDRTEMQELSREIGEMNKMLGKLEGRLSGIGRAVDLMNQHLIGHER